MNGQIQVAQSLERAGAATATTGGLWMWLGENHDAIAALGVLVGAAVGVAGLILHWWYLHRHSKRRDRRREDRE